MVIEVKLRQVGNALGFILPKRVLTAERLRKGQRVFVRISRTRDYDLTSVLGMAKGAGPFVREHDHRDEVF